MRVLGYPPAWRDPEALAQHSRGGGLLDMYMTADATEEDATPIPVGGDGMPVRYPGFNAPLERPASPDKPQTVDMEVSDDEGGEEEAGNGGGTLGGTLGGTHGGGGGLADGGRFLTALRERDGATALRLLQLHPQLASLPDALHRASSTGAVAVVQHILDSGLSHVNARTPAGDTALHLAAYGGHANVVRALVRAGADVAATTPEGMTAEALAGARHDVRAAIEGR